jgi:transposase-like protein
MKRYRREAREKITRHYHESGQSIGQYSQHYDLSEASLKRWIKEFREPESGADPKISFVEIQTGKTMVKPQAEKMVHAVTIRYPNGMSIELGQGTDICWAGELLTLVGTLA